MPEWPARRAAAARGCALCHGLLVQRTFTRFQLALIGSWHGRVRQLGASRAAWGGPLWLPPRKLDTDDWAIALNRTRTATASSSSSTAS